MYQFVFFLLSIFLFFTTSHLYSRERIALIIGNSNYQESALTNPRNDAKKIHSVLEELNFSSTLLLDVAHEEMETAIMQFGERLTLDSIGFFYYAGHAVQFDGKNFLIPIGAIPQISSKLHMKYKTVALDYILGTMETAPNALNLLVLDSCRNNPFKNRSFFSKGRGVFSTRGLAKSEENLQGVLIAYSTSPGNVALDGDDENSPYTTYLLKHLKEPGLSIESVLKKVRKSVKKVTNGKQIPWYESSIDGEFYPNPLPEEEINLDEINALKEKIRIQQEALERNNQEFVAREKKNQEQKLTLENSFEAAQTKKLLTMEEQYQKRQKQLEKQEKELKKQQKMIESKREERIESVEDEEEYKVRNFSVF